MKIRIAHERTVAALPEQIVGLISDIRSIWPTQFSPAPRLRGDRVYKAGLMIWEEVDRPGAARAFRVVEPPGLQLEHWFELEATAGATVIRHIVEGRAVGQFEAIWREQIEPAHSPLMEALFDNVEAATAPAGR